jgi:hypothetical protein
MNNDVALAAMVAKRAAINAAINDFNRYLQEVEASRWSNAVKSAQMQAIKASALAGSVNIAAWTGLPAED